MESPLRLTAHGGFGEGDEETRSSRDGKVRFVPTLLGGERPEMVSCYPTGLSRGQFIISTKAVRG
jgi:hypothetical protein